MNIRPKTVISPGRYRVNLLEASMDAPFQRDLWIMFILHRYWTARCLKRWNPQQARAKSQKTISTSSLQPHSSWLTRVCRWVASFIQCPCDKRTIPNEHSQLGIDSDNILASFTNHFARNLSTLISDWETLKPTAALVTAVETVYPLSVTKDVENKRQ